MPALEFVNEQEQVKLPVGGDFTNGLIAAWFAQVVAGFYSETDLGTLENVPKPTFARQMGKGFRYFYANYEDAKKANEACGNQYPPKTMWQFLTERAKVLNVTEEHIAKFADPISLELEISTLKSKKRRHELHMIALPAAVAAAATYMGIDNPGFDLSELFSQDAIFDDAFQCKMIGSPDNGGFKESELWKRRASLWFALGETNPEAYQPTGTGSKFDTSSEKLSACLCILAKPWKSAVWARVSQVPSPVMDAVYGDENKRLSIPALTFLYESEKAARDAATEELARKAKSEEKNGHSEPTSELKIPAQWVGQEQAWKDYVLEIKKVVAGKPQPLIVKYLTENVSQIGATPEESLPWVLAV